MEVRSRCQRIPTLPQLSNCRKSIRVAKSDQKNVCIKQIDPISAGTTLGAMYGMIGVIIGGVMFLLTMVGTGISGNSMGLVTGMGAIIMLPIIYGIAGFIGGILSAAVYNVVCGMTGGIRMKMDIG